MGYHRAGFDVIGIDIKKQPHYPFTFIQGDALNPPVDLSRFDAIHASPPCQGYSRLRHLPWLRGKTWPLLIGPIRKLLQDSGLPWIIENVEDAPLDGLVLCGTMFNRPLYRHRVFESSNLLLQPTHESHREIIGHGRMVNDRRKGTLNAGSNKGAWGNQKIITVAGGQFRKADAVRALEIDWMSVDELAQAIPPAYCEFIGRQLITGLIADGRLPPDFSPERIGDTCVSLDQKKDSLRHKDVPAGNESSEHLYPSPSGGSDENLRRSRLLQDERD